MRRRQLNPIGILRPCGLGILPNVIDGRPTSDALAGFFFFSFFLSFFFSPVCSLARGVLRAFKRFASIPCHRTPNPPTSTFGPTQPRLYDRTIVPIMAHEPLYGSCSCGRNHYRVSIPDDVTEHAHVYFDSSRDNRSYHSSHTSNPI